VSQVLSMDTGRPAKRYCFVVPRFGLGVGAGAETLMREIALRLAKRGEEVHVLTTCAKDNRTWENSLPEDVTNEDGITVYRYKVDERNLNVWVPYQVNISEGINPGVEAQLDWLTHSVNSTGLYEHIKNNADSFDALFFGPYLFGTTFWGSLIRPDKSILIPCLHDENYAYLETLSSMFRLVKGCVFNANAEMEFANNLYGHIKGGEVGMGFEPLDKDYVANLKPYLDLNLKYILYVGRKEMGKNAHKLIDNFVAAKNSGRIDENLKLVFVGPGSFDDLMRPQALKRSDIVDIGFLSEADKHGLIKHALSVVQPSRNESFSIVLMEAWLLGVPVIVDSGCAVTREHVLESNGGLYYDSNDEFGEVVRYLEHDPNLCKALGSNGYEYVLNKYSWKAVLNRFDTVMESLLEG